MVKVPTPQRQLLPTEYDQNIHRAQFNDVMEEFWSTMGNIHSWCEDFDDPGISEPNLKPVTLLMWQRVIWNAFNWVCATLCPPYPDSFPYPEQLGFLGSLITDLPTGRFTMPYDDQQHTHNQPVDLFSSPNVLMESQFLSKNVYEPLSGDDEEDNPMDTPPPPSQEVVTTTTSMVSVVDKTH